MKHDWKTVWSVETGALYECRRCGINHRVQFVGKDIYTLYPEFLDHVCRPMDALKTTLDAEQAAIKGIVDATKKQEGGA